MIELLWNGIPADAETEALVRNAIQTALLLAGTSGDVSILLTDEEEIRALNQTYRNVDSVTDVLTFPAWEGDQIIAPPDGYLGDIAICFPRAVEQAEAYGHSLKREIAFLSVHGALHLSGYDHLQQDEEQNMLAMQDEILGKMGLKR
ncbi:MAG: rRNA maturation RNase YbeY [Clostridia bacterium]